MLFSKHGTFVLLALSASVDAFNLPVPNSIIGPSQYAQLGKPAKPAKLAKSAKYNNFDHSLNIGKKSDVESTATEIDNGRNDLIAPGIYSIFTGMLIYIIYQLRDAFVLTTIGSKALALVTGALIYDNIMIAIGSLFFRDVEENPTKYKILNALSFPRFTLHAVAVPFQCVTVCEMGKFAGVGFLQNDLFQIAAVVVAVVVAFVDRKKFVDSPGITLTTYEDSPFDALERDLVKFSYKEFDIAFLLPVIVLTVWTIGVGIAARGAYISPELGNWMVFGGVGALVGNALPGPIMTFAGNLGEIALQFGLLNAARIVYGGGS